MSSRRLGKGRERGTGGRAGGGQGREARQGMGWRVHKEEESKEGRVRRGQGREAM